MKNKAIRKEGAAGYNQNGIGEMSRKVKGMSYGDKTLFFLSVFVLASLLIYTFTGANLVINSDTATANLLAEEMVRTRSYFPKSWCAGQDVWVFFLHTFIAVFTLFSDDYILMHSWASTIFIVMGVLSCIYCSRKASKNNSWLVSLPLLFCGISGEYTEIVFGQCAYLPPLIYLFFFISLYIDSIDENTFHIKSKPKFVLLLFLIAFVGLSGVRYIQVFGVPILGTIVISYTADHFNDSMKKFFYSSKAMAAIAVSVCIAVAAGFLGFLKLSSQINFTMGVAAIQYADWNIFERIVVLINNFLILFGFSYNISFMSLGGIINVFKIVFGVLFFIVIPILQVRNIKKEEKSMRLFIIFSLLHIAEILLLSVFTYLNPERISRYLFTMGFLLLFLSGHYIYKYFIMGKSDIAKLISVCSVVIYVASCSVPKFTSFINYDEKIANEKSVTEHLKDMELSYGYATYWHAGRHTMLSDGKVEINSVNIDSRISPFYWLNSKDRYEANSGTCFLMLTEGENNLFVNSTSYTEFGEPLYVEQYNGFWIYVYDYNIGHNEFEGKVPLENAA